MKASIRLHWVLCWDQFMAALVPFVVLGVGCDDILVFYDTWRQQGAASADLNDWGVFKKAYTTAGKVERPSLAAYAQFAHILAV